MKLDEAIKRAEEVVTEQDKLCKRYDDASGYTRSHNEEIRTSDAKKCEKCANEHRQLAEWLKELKQLREQTKWIPCNERLPKQNECVDKVCKYYLIQDEYGDMYIAHYTNYGWVPVDSLYVLDNNVVAWMSLPEEYKAGM